MTNFVEADKTITLSICYHCKKRIHAKLFFVVLQMTDCSPLALFQQKQPDIHL